MAKKSAKSKGYRKTVKKRPYLTKKEITITVAIVAIIVLGLILFNLLYDDGSLKVVNGVAQAQGDSLIINEGTSRSPRYFKVGQLADIDGYSKESEPITSDDNVLKYTYTPAGESAIERVSVYAYGFSAQTFADATLASYSSADYVTCSEMQTLESNGHDVCYFIYRSVPVVEESTGEDDAEEEAAEPLDTTCVQSLSAYVSVGDRCINIIVRNEAETEEGFVDDSELTDALDQVLAALSYETK